MKWAVKWWVRYVTAFQNWPIHRVTALLLFAGFLALLVILILTLGWQFIAYLRVIRNTANRSIGYHDFLAIRAAVLTHAVPARMGDLKLMSLRVRAAGDVEVWTGKLAGLRMRAAGCSDCTESADSGKSSAKAPGPFRRAVRAIHSTVARPAPRIFSTHTLSRKYSMVWRRPVSRSTFGSQPSNSLARPMLGRRCLGSSTGSAS